MGAGPSIQGAEVLVAVVADDETRRAALCGAFAGDARHRVVCSTSLEHAAAQLAGRRVDLLVGLGAASEDWERFRALAACVPRAVRVLVVADPSPAGAALLPASVVDALARLAPGTDRAAGDDDRRRLACLTMRERQVLALTAQGFSIKEIAHRLHRSYGTVASHRAHIMEKLDLHDRVALTRYALRMGCDAEHG